VSPEPAYAEGAASPLVTKGQRLLAADGVVYVAERVNRDPVPVKLPNGRVVASKAFVKHSLTLRRETPKVRGKAAVKAAKRARRFAYGSRRKFGLNTATVGIDWGADRS